ncbi:ABC transporter ATP-binding protein [Pusillimonas caeni]|uniref:ABC transporter ATP-binding protein n=1 Tax=Pusillimonas caeni TaxID=1348472 RepID=UPI000E59F555|nr:ABC transporter ATP-binding protein [Pusillimonas caeni]TFL15821.1 ABC transporter ATP-binding protein [Pusillimonas caeni]
MTDELYVLSASGLSRRFGGLIAIDNVSLNLKKGARHALIGPNGAGKTTFVNLLTGVLRPSSGTILLNGDDITRLPVHKRSRRGLVRTFQINQLFESLTPLETLAIVISERAGLGTKLWRPLGADPSIARRCHELLQQLRLLDVMDRPTKQLPYGKRRQLEIAIALACDPKVLLLDEPVAGVPAGERSELLSIIASLPEDISILLIEHDMDLVFSFATGMTVLVNGSLLMEADPATVSNDPRVKEVYLGHGAPAAASTPIEVRYA